jgi:hypothetical protein
MVSGANMTRPFDLWPVDTRCFLPSSPIRMRKNRTKLWGEEDLQIEKAALTPPDYSLDIKSQVCDYIRTKGAIPHTFAKNREPT